MLSGQNFWDRFESGLYPHQNQRDVEGNNESWTPFQESRASSSSSTSSDNYSLSSSPYFSIWPSQDSLAYLSDVSSSSQVSPDPKCEDVFFLEHGRALNSSEGCVSHDSPQQSLMSLDCQEERSRADSPGEFNPILTYCLENLRMFRVDRLLLEYFLGLRSFVPSGEGMDDIRDMQERSSREVLWDILSASKAELEEFRQLLTGTWRFQQSDLMAALRTMYLADGKLHAGMRNSNHRGNGLLQNWEEVQKLIIFQFVNADADGKNCVSNQECSASMVLIPQLSDIVCQIRAGIYEVLGKVTLPPGAAPAPLVGASNEAGAQFLQSNVFNEPKALFPGMISQLPYKHVEISTLPMTRFPPSRKPKNAFQMQWFQKLDRRSF